MSSIQFCSIGHFNCGFYFLSIYLSHYPSSIVPSSDWQSFCWIFWKWATSPSHQHLSGIVTASRVQEELSRTNQPMSLRLWQPAEYRFSYQYQINLRRWDCDIKQSINTITGLINKSHWFHQGHGGHIHIGALHVGFVVSDEVTVFWKIRVLPFWVSLQDASGLVDSC